MAKTINSYVPDRGELSVTISAGDVSAMAAFTTAEAVTKMGLLESERKQRQEPRSIPKFMLLALVTLLRPLAPRSTQQCGRSQ